MNKKLPGQAGYRQSTKSAHGMNNKVRYSDATESAYRDVIRYAQRRTEHDAQHGPVRVIVKDGIEVRDVAKPE